MPNIPYAGETLLRPKALPDVRQNINVSPDTFGAAAFRGVEKLGNDLQTVAHNVEKINDIMDQEDTRKAREAWAQAQAEAEAAANKARATKGVDVAPKEKPTLTQSFDSDLQKIYGKHTQGLSENARAKFDAVWNPHATVRKSQIEIHQTEQLEAVDIATSEAGISQAQQDIATAVSQLRPGDPTSEVRVDMAVKEAKRRIGMEVAYIGRLKKQPYEVSKERMDAEVTKGHLNAVSALMASDNPGLARQYYDTHKEEIDSRLRAGVEEKLQQHTEVTQSQQAADLLWAKHGGDLTAALEEARKAHSGSLEEKVVTQLKVRAGEAEDAKKKQDRVNFNTALDKILNAPTASDAVAAAMKADIEPEIRLKLITVANGLVRAERGEAGNPAGFVEVAELVDKGEITDAKTAQAAAASRGMSKKEISDAVKYVQQGGLAGEVKVSEVTRLAKGFKPKITANEVGALTQYIIEDLKKQSPGKAVSPEELQQRVASYLWSGETTSRVRPGKEPEKPGFFTFGAGWNENALAARKAGNIESWLPDVSSDEDIDLRVELSGLTGLQPDAFDEETIRIFKKQKAGLPLGTTQRTKVPARVKKDTTPQETGPSARQRSAASAAAAILDNYTTN